MTDFRSQPDIVEQLREHGWSVAAEAADEIERLRAIPKETPPRPDVAGREALPQLVEVTIRRLETLADTALDGRLYEQECKAQMRLACSLLRDAYSSTGSGDAYAGPVPRLTDNDAGEITVTLDDKELRGWSYKDDTERRAKMLAAREYVEGWNDGRQA